MTYNLIDEEWIPVLYHDGRFERIGIWRALTEAGRIRQIAASNPMDRLALLRFLTAVLLWCREDAKSASASLADTAEGVPEDWLTRLREHTSAFNLLGDGRRFYQDESVKDNELRPIADLLVEFPGKDSVNHFRHVLHGTYGFCPACCAVGILRLSVWAPANEHYPASVNPASAAYTIVEDRNLLATILANLPTEAVMADCAPWLCDRAPEAPGAVAKLAWRPRRLWLHADGTEGVCASCGRHGALLNALCNKGGWPTPVTEGQTFAKNLEAEFKKLGYNLRGRDTASRTVIKKIAQNAALIRRCRMDELRCAYAATLPTGDCDSPPAETEEQQIARMCDHLIRHGAEAAIQALTTKASPRERTDLEPENTRSKKFWDADPHLLRGTEPVSLPSLVDDAGKHSSKLWRAAVRLGQEVAGKVTAVGPVVNKFTFQDATSVVLPGMAWVRSVLAEDINLHDLLKGLVPNRERKHPEIKAAVVALTPDAEARTRAALMKADATAEVEKDLKDIQEDLKDILLSQVRRAVAATSPGSPLKRLAAQRRAESQLSETIAARVRKPAPAVMSTDADKPVPAKPRATRKRKGADA